MKKTMAILFALTIATAAQAASTVSVADDSGEKYGKTTGVAIDFDATTGLTADWTPDLTNGRLYRVESLSLFLKSPGLIDEDLYLGVYTNLDEQIGVQAAATLGGFLGVSDNTFNLATASTNTALTWTFSAIAPEVAPRNNPGFGDDILYFILQTGTEALADVGLQPGTDERLFLRVASGSFDDELSAVIHGSRADDPNSRDLLNTRALEYEAQVTDVGSAPPPPDPPAPLDSSVVVTDGDANDYGKTSGVAIDFDATTGLSAEWTPELAAGATYQLDSLTLFLGAPGLVDENVYLGVYTGLSGKTLSGFLGVSDNVFNLTTAPIDTDLTWTFDSIAPAVIPESNPGSGGDILYFALQFETNALEVLESPATGATPFRRIDSGGSFNDELSAVLRDTGLLTTRALEYKAQLSVAGLSYSAWIAQFDTGGLNNRSDDVEPDGMSNEIEYYLGGNPTIDDAGTIMPVSRIIEMGASNVFEYAYRRRTDNPSLSYDLLLNTSGLVVGDWNSVSDAYQVGIGATEEEGVESVTNHFPTTDPTQFINLEVTEED